MKKVLTTILVLTLVLTLIGCNQNAEDTVSSDMELTEEKRNVSIDSAEALSEVAEADIEDTISKLQEEYEELKIEVDTFDKYVNCDGKVEEFYLKILEEEQLLCIRLREYCVQCSDLILSSNTSFDEKYDEFEILYDVIYEDAGDEIYDEIYDGILDDMYDDFYDGIIDDAYDTVPYKDWSDARSDEYDLWSDTRSGAYDEWSDFRSDVYDFWSDMRSEMWDDDIERAREKMEDFLEDINALKNEEEHSAAKDETESEKSTAKQPEEAVDSELVDGMRPEFKSAMDSYEAFYDEYCEFMVEFNENPSDTKLLTKYADMMSKLYEINGAFEEWDEDEMNDVELKYYMEVSGRITEKLLEVA